MAISNSSTQLRYTQKGYLDSKTSPVQSIEELNKIKTNLYVPGMSVYVIDEKRDYVFNGTSWEPKSAGADIYISGDDVQTE